MHVISLSVTRYQQLGHEVSVKQALEECAAIDRQLAEKQVQIEAIGGMGRALVGGAPSAEADSQGQLHQQWLDVQSALHKTKDTLQQRQHHWGMYHAAKDKVFFLTH